LTLHWSKRAYAWLGAVAGLVFVLVASVARAEERAQGLPAVISIGASSLDPVAVQQAIETELQVPLVIDPTAAQRLEIAITGRRVNVTYVTPGREPVTRSVDLPKDEPRALQTLAFLAGNLARDEAGELLAQLAPPPGESPADAPPPPPLPPPPAEAPPAPSAAPPKVVPPAEPAAPKLLTSPRFAANVSLYYPLTARKHTEQWRLNLELGVAYSRVGAINGVAMNLGGLRVDQTVDGFAGAIFWTRTDGDVRGIAGSLLVAESYGRLRGIGFATLVNLHPGKVDGLQASALVTTAGDVLGIEGGALVAVGRDIQGFQGSAGLTLGRDLRGAQLGVVNVARDARGAQVSIVNVARRVNGVQIGLVNVADEIHGGAIGLVNVAGNGRFQPVAWFAGPGAYLVGGYRTITDLTYLHAGVGYDLAHDHYRYEVGTGLHLALPYGFYGETGPGFAQSYVARGGADVRKELRYDFRVGMEPVRGVTPFIGGTLTRRLSGGGADYRGEYSFGVSFL